MRVLVCGSRGWTNRKAIYRELSKLSGDVVVIHGAARGADTIAGEVAKELGFEVLACPPEWKRYGRAAGPIRNKTMLHDHCPKLVLAFPRNLSQSPGTRHMIEIARAAGVEVKVFEEKNDESRPSDLGTKGASEFRASRRPIIAFTKVALPFGWLGNMSPYSVTYQGDEYASAEALFQCLRFDDEEIQTRIWEQSSPMSAKMVAKKYRAKMIIEPMGEQDVENMGLVLMLKIEQHAQIRSRLLETGDAEILEDCTRRRKQASALFWGSAFIEGRWSGKNVLGKLWMELREEIRRGEW